MQTPSFWYSRGLWAWILLPLSVFYPLFVWVRFRLTRTHRYHVPVICVGGLTAGGAGKTPVALHVGALCKEKNINAWFVSRGYLGKAEGPLQVKPAEHTSLDVGDEPLLLAHTLPTIVAKNRRAGIDFALRQGAELVITDDGFQNPSIHKDISLLVVDGKYGWGNGFTLPAGPLREWLFFALARASAIIVINPAYGFALAKHATILHAYTEPDADARSLAGKRVTAFCGLAIPQKFFDTLEHIGAEITARHVYADHYPYREEEIEQLALKAKEQQAILVTTSKDAARLPARLRSLVTVVHIGLRFEKPEQLAALLVPVMTSTHEKDTAA